MTSNDIQTIVLKYLVGRYYNLKVGHKRLVNYIRDVSLASLPSFVCNAEMNVEDFLSFRRDCEEAGIAIIATWDGYERFTIIATERL